MYMSMALVLETTAAHAMRPCHTQCSSSPTHRAECASNENLKDILENCLFFFIFHFYSPSTPLHLIFSSLKDHAIHSIIKRRNNFVVFAIIWIYMMKRWDRTIKLNAFEKHETASGRAREGEREEHRAEQWRATKRNNKTKFNEAPLF